MDKEAIYTAKIFLNSAIPLLKVIIEETSLHKMFAKRPVSSSFPSRTRATSGPLTSFSTRVTSR